MITRANYFLLAVRNLDRACRFYENTLGLNLINRRDSVGWAEFDLGNLRLGLYLSVEESETRYLSATVRLEVNEIESTFEKLQALGVKTVGGIDYDEPHGIFTIQDPDGNLIDLAGPGEYESEQDD